MTYVKICAEEHDREAPGDSADKDDLRHLSDPTERDWYQRLGGEEREAGKNRYADEGSDDRKELRMLQVRLQNDHHDRPHVFDDEKAQGDAPGSRVEFERFLKQLDDKQRR